MNADTECIPSPVNWFRLHMHAHEDLHLKTGIDIFEEQNEITRLLDYRGRSERGYTHASV